MIESNNNASSLRRVRVKICSICSPIDAELAVNAGADALGFIFHSASKRFLNVHEARMAMSMIPAWVMPVGVFVNPTLENISLTIQSLNLPCVQLQGDETPDLARDIAAMGVRVIKAFKVDDQLSGKLDSWRKVYREVPQFFTGILLETASKEPGGSGEENNWNAIEELKKQNVFNMLPPIILAGGLTPENVGQVVKRLRPYGVDVSSGVEAQVRVKDPEKIAKFMSAISPSCI
jgi:phosphoribosylanthranilate isomerase